MKKEKVKKRTKLKYVFEVHRETQDGFISLGLYNDLDEANKVAEDWNKSRVVRWDIAAVSKREVK